MAFRKGKLSVLIATATVVVLLASTLAGCSSSKSGGEILIGTIQDTTGGTSALGRASLNGVQVAVDEINAKGGIGGKKIKLINYDTKNDVTEGVNTYRRLAEQDKVLAVVGPPTSNIGIAIAPIAEQLKVPVLGGFLDERCTTTEDGKLWNYMYLGQPSAGQTSRIIASYAINQLGFKKFSMLYNQSNAYAVSLAKPFMEYVKAVGAEMVEVQTFQDTDKEYRSQLLKIKEKNPQAIFFPNYPQQIPLNLQQAKQVGLPATVLGTNAWIPYAFMAKDEAEGSYFPYNIDMDTPSAKEWGTKYKSRFNVDVIAHAYMGYDYAMTIFTAMQNVPKGTKLTAQAVKEQLDKVTYSGFTGLMKFEAKTHRLDKPSMVIMQVRKGVAVVLGTYSAPDR